MGTPHKHCNLIVAWANGADIQYLDVNGMWTDCSKDGPHWDDETEYRIKPKTVKREGWVNVYDYNDASIWPSKEEADSRATAWRKACIRIEWEEEV